MQFELNSCSTLKSLIKSPTVKHKCLFEKCMNFFFSKFFFGSILVKEWWTPMFKKCKNILNRTLPEYVNCFQNLQVVIICLEQKQHFLSFFFEYCKNAKFVNYVNISGQTLSSLPESQLRALLVRFLFSLKGTRYRYIFDVESPITCGKPLPEIKVLY